MNCLSWINLWWDMMTPLVEAFKWRNSSRWELKNLICMALLHERHQGLGHNSSPAVYIKIVTPSKETWLEDYFTFYVLRYPSVRFLFLHIFALSHCRRRRILWISAWGLSPFFHNNLMLHLLKWDKTFDPCWGEVLRSWGRTVGKEPWRRADHRGDND